MSLLATRMQNLRASGNLDKNEFRPSRYGALDVFMQQTNDPAGILTPELRQAAERSIGRTLETPVIDYDGTITIGTTRTVDIADSENNSKMYQLTFATYAWGFTIVPAMYMNNEISMQRDFEVKFNKYLYAFAKSWTVFVFQRSKPPKRRYLRTSSITRQRAMSLTHLGSTVRALSATLTRLWRQTTTLCRCT